MGRDRERVGRDRQTEKQAARDRDGIISGKTGQKSKDRERNRDTKREGGGGGMGKEVRPREGGGRNRE